MHLDTNDLRRARETLHEDGGWLLDLGEGHYLVTDDEGTVRGLRGVDYTEERGENFVSRCERLQCWDETRLDELEG